MPIYYLNTSSPIREFYTDACHIRDILSVARPTEFVRLTYYLGVNEFNKKVKTIHHGKASPELKVLMDWLPAEIVLKKLAEAYLFSREYIIEFDSGLIATCRAPGDLIINYREERTEDLFRAFSVPPSIQAAMMTNPGSLYFALSRTGQYWYLGYFKNVRLWYKQNKMEKALKGAFYTVNLN